MEKDRIITNIIDASMAGRQIYVDHGSDAGTVKLFCFYKEPQHMMRLILYRWYGKRAERTMDITAREAIAIVEKTFAFCDHDFMDRYSVHEPS